MFISDSAAKKIQQLTTSCAQDIAVLRKKRLALVKAYIEKKSKRAQKDILEKIIKM